MVMNMKCYSAMKDSSIKWLGEIPAHWEVRKLRTQFRMHGSGTTPSGDHYYGGGVPWVMTGDLNDFDITKTKRTVTPAAVEKISALRMFPPGSLLVAMYGATIGKTGILTMKACTNQACCVLAECTGSSSISLLQVMVNLARPHLIEQSYGGGQPNINADIVRSLKVPIPPLPEQAAIVRYLDYVERRIQRYAGTKRKLLGLLAEQKQAIIHHAVTRGLDPDVSLKPSGIEWLGDVPAHWDLVPNRSILHRRKVLVGNRHSEHQLLSLTKGGVIVRDISTGRGKFSADMGTSQEVRAGNLIFCLFDVPETPRTVGLSPHAGMITGAYMVFECHDTQLARYVEAFYIAMDDRKLLSPLYSGLRNTIRPLTFLGIKTPAPPPTEQTAIVEYLDKITARIDAVIARTHREIELINEYRTRLIADVVTGKVDVREAVAKLPDEADADDVMPDSDTDGTLDSDTTFDEAAKLDMVAEPDREY